MRLWRRLDAGGRAGAVLVLFVLLVAFFGPLASPYSPTKTVGQEGMTPNVHDLLGTDFVGRDVLSRVLYGGRSLILLGVAATVLGYLVGAVVGLISGYSRSIADPLLMRGVDVLRAFPPLLVLLVLATGAGNGIPVLILGVALVQFPPISRIFRTATLEASQASYVDAAVVRGERTCGDPVPRDPAKHRRPGGGDRRAELLPLGHPHLEHELPRPRASAAGCRLGPHGRRRTATSST